MVPYTQRENINGIYMVSPDTGFVVTSGGILSRTNDGGKDWRSWWIAKGRSLEDLHFITSDIGWVCGERGIIMSTTDGGIHWTNKQGMDTVSWMFDIEFLDRAHGLAIGVTRQEDAPMTGLAYRTTDGGIRWDKMETIGAGYSEIFTRYTFSLTARSTIRKISANPGIGSRQWTASRPERSHCTAPPA